MHKKQGGILKGERPPWKLGHGPREAAFRSKRRMAGEGWCTEISQDN